MKNYKRRVIDTAIENRLKSKGAILVEGAKWCGKTTTCEQHAASVLYMSDPDRVKQNLQLADISPRSLLHGDTPRLIDEWQMAPKLWDAVRFEADHRDGFGHFLLTGSAVPADMDQVHHAGTCCFSWIKMRPMSLYESEESTGEVSLNALFSDAEKELFAESKITLEDIAFLICRGGWPQATFLDGEDALSQSFDYLDAVVKSDISRVDGVSRNENRARLLLRSLARHQGTQAPNTTICEDINVKDKRIDFGMNYTELFEAFINSTESSNMNHYRSLLCILNKMLFYDCKHIQHLLTDIYAYTYLVDDYLKLSDMETYKMTYLFSPVNNGTLEQQIEKLPYTCAEIGLKIPKPDFKSYNYSFIRELKLLNAIKDYYFFIEYRDDNDNEGNLIIGIQPHEYNKNKYKANQLTEINTVQSSFYLYWQLKFDEIYFNLKEGNDLKKINFVNLDSGLNHNLNIIIAPFEYLEIIEKEFFNKRNCQRNRLENNYYNFDCSSKQDIEDFPSLYFTHRTLGYTFEISYKDVFIEYNGRYMCLIWFDMSTRNNWNFGKPFLKKYFFSYNLDKKMIGFYNMDIKETPHEKKTNLTVLYVILIFLLLLIVIAVNYYSTKKFCKEKKQTQKAQLLELAEDIGVSTENSIND